MHWGAHNAQADAEINVKVALAMYLDSSVRYWVPYDSDDDLDPAGDEYLQNFSSIKVQIKNMDDLDKNSQETHG